MKNDKHTTPKGKHATENVKHTTEKDKHAAANDDTAKEKVKHATTHLKHSLSGGKGVHIGYTIGRLLKQQDITFPELARRLGIAPQNARAMLKKKYLHAATMVKISEVLEHDIIRYLYLPENLPGNKALKEKVTEMEKEMEALKKENGMLKEMNALLKGRS